MIKAHGKTYQTVAEARDAWDALEAVNRSYEYSDGRVTEQNAILDAIREYENALPDIAPLTEEQADVWTVEKQEYEMPCDHPQCVVLHQHLNNASYRTPTNVEYADRWGNEHVVYNVRRYHMATRREWVILLNGKREGEAGHFDTYNTKREALAALRSAGLL